MSMEGTNAYLLERFYIRQQDIINKASLVPVSILGCGASGSALGLQLAKLGVPMLGLWDADIVEEHNLSNQYYPNSEEWRLPDINGSCGYPSGVRQSFDLHNNNPPVIKRVSHNL